MKEKIIYFDNAATTVTDEEAAEYACKMMREVYANPSSAHSFGFEAEKHLKEARENVLHALGYTSRDGDVVFTSCGTESDNMALFGAAKAKRRRGNRIVISDSEHPAVENAAKELETQGFELIRIPTRGGKIDLDFAASEINEKTVLVSCMTVNNETGAQYDLQSLSEITRRNAPNAYFHTDAVQGFTKVRNISAFDADLISVSGHKIHAPKGVGALFIKKGVRVPSLLYGGGQEGGLRSGTEAMPSICAFGLAARRASDEQSEREAHFASLNSYLREKIARETDGVIINSGTEGFAKHIVSIALPGIRSEIMLRYLSERGIYVSAGSACSSKKADNRVLSNFGLSEKEADSTLRISFSKYNTTCEIDALTENIKQGMTTLQRVGK